MAESSELIHFTVEQPDRLDRFLHAQWDDLSRTRIAEWILAGEVQIDGEVRTRPGMSLKPGMHVSCAHPPDRTSHDLTPYDLEIPVIYEDASLLVVNKPRGLATHPASSLHEPSLVNALLARSITLSTEAGAWRPGIVHRLDKDTTGLLVVAKTDSAHRYLAAQIQAKTAERRYIAVVNGKLEQAQFRVVAPIGRDPVHRVRMAIVSEGKLAETEVKILVPLGSDAVVACRLLTGRTHQIRVHLASVSLPVIGDPLYAPVRIANGPLQLHAAYLSFVHPITRAKVEFFAGPPDDFMYRDRFDVHALSSW